MFFLITIKKLMNLKFDLTLCENYKSNSQISRVLTENWLKANGYCPNCNKEYLNEYLNNKPVADFFCSSCNEDYELKSKKGMNVGKKIVDGAFSSMIERINSDSNPNFFFLTYNNITWSVNNFLIIPKHFFIPQIIEQRKPLSVNAKRAGWIGCNIDLQKIPESGRIFLIKNKKVLSRDLVKEKWNKTVFLKTKTLKSKGWLIETLNCIDKINSSTFTLDEMYKFENELKTKFPNNSFVKDKIRQQLQILRDKGIIEFKARGLYKKII